MSKKPWHAQQQTTQNQLANVPNAQAQAAQALGAAGQLAMPEPLPPAAPSGAIVLDHPTIELGEHIFVGTPPTQQTKRLKPERAYVYQGAIVIDELNLILPLAGNYVRTR